MTHPDNPRVPMSATARYRSGHALDFVRVLAGLGVLLGCLLACAPLSADGSPAKRAAAFTAKTGGYTLSFSASRGAITIRPQGTSDSLAIHEFPGKKALNLF